MITREEAQVLVDQYLASRRPAPEDGPRIVRPEQTQEFPGCWVCFWNSRKYIETGDKGYRLGGNYPIIVDKAEGTLYSTGVYALEGYIESFHGDKEKLKRLTPARRA